MVSNSILKVNNYEKHTNNIKERLDEILGSFFRGLMGDTHTDYDKAKEGVKTGRDYGEYLSSHGSKEEIEAMAGQPSLYKLGKNYADEVDEKLKEYLFFSIDHEETKSKGVLVHSSDIARALKLTPSIEWLFKGVWRAKKLRLSRTNKTGEGSIEGKLVEFVGIWEDGTFMGILSGGSIEGGWIKDGYYIGNADGFKISPWNFKSGGYSPSSEFVLGMPIAKDNTKYKTLSIFQVPSDKKIKIVDNNDVEHILNVERGVSFETLNIKINGNEVFWSPYSNSKSDFEKSFIKVGETFDLPEVLLIDKGIQSIEVKTSEYESQAPESQATESKMPENWNKFDVKSNVKGWTPGTKGGYFIDVEEDDEETISSIQKFKDDINSGKFFKYLNFFKQLIDEGRIDGYGNYPSLAFLFPKQVGSTYKSDDPERDRVMKYFSDFRQKVINNFRAENVTKYYLGLLKKYVETDSVTISKTQKTTKSKGGARGGTVTESKLSILDILKKTI